MGRLECLGWWAGRRWLQGSAGSTIEAVHARAPRENEAAAHSITCAAFVCVVCVIYPPPTSPVAHSPQSSGFRKTSLNGT